MDPQLRVNRQFLGLGQIQMQPSGGGLNLQKLQRPSGNVRYLTDYDCIVCIFNVRKGEDRCEGKRDIMPEPFLHFAHHYT
eukprot:10050415-Alexandrium_andersonii.AAC.1